MNINNEFKCVYCNMCNCNITIFSSQFCTVSIQLDTAQFIALINVTYLMDDYQ